MTDKQPHAPRKHPNHSPHPRDDLDIIFVTVCTHQRACFLDNDVVHLTLTRLWLDASHWIVGRYVIMPDHIHLFVVRAGSSTTPMNKWIGWWKREASSKLELGRGAWQGDYWDTRMRSAEHYSSKWIYVRDNPVRAGLVERTELWRYQGEIHKLIA
jgi:putative transposase